MLSLLVHVNMERSSAELYSASKIATPRLHDNTYQPPSLELPQCPPTVFLRVELKPFRVKESSLGLLVAHS